MGARSSKHAVGVAARRYPQTVSMIKDAGDPAILSATQRPTPSTEAATSFQAESQQQQQQQPSTTYNNGSSNPLDPRVEHQRLLQNFAQIQFEIKPVSKFESKPANELLSIVNTRRERDARLEEDDRNLFVRPEGKLKAAELELLFSQRKTKLSSPEDLADQFKLPKETVKALLLHLNSIESVGSTSGNVSARWIEDMAEYRRNEARRI